MEDAPVATQPLSKRVRSYGILALCSSTPVILADDYIAGMPAGSSSIERNHERDDDSCPRIAIYRFNDRSGDVPRLTA